MVQIMTTGERLGEFARLMNEFGADSGEAKQFLEANRADDEFVELANLSRQLKLELQPDSRSAANAKVTNR